MVVRDIDIDLTGGFLKDTEVENFKVNSEIVKFSYEEFQKNIQELQKNSPDKFNKLIENINRIMNAMDVQIRFSIYEETKDVIIRLIDVKRNYVIREIPPTKIVRIINEILKLAGIVFDEKI
jgi:flagellar protein FlaG